MNLSLNMERGQPADDNFDLSLPILDIDGPNDVVTASGFDIRGLMRDHAPFLIPKFDAVQEVLQGTSGDNGLASWTDPKGGYFVSLDNSRPCKW